MKIKSLAGIVALGTIFSASSLVAEEVRPLDRSKESIPIYETNWRGYALANKVDLSEFGNLYEIIEVSLTKPCLDENGRRKENLRLHIPSEAVAVLSYNPRKIDDYGIPICYGEALIPKK